MDNNLWLDGSPAYSTTAVGVTNLVDEQRAENLAKKAHPYTEAQIEDALNRYRDGDRSSDVLNIISYKNE